MSSLGTNAYPGSAPQAQLNADGAHSSSGLPHTAASSKASPVLFRSSG